MMDEKRLYFLDVIRIWACLLVVLFHCNRYVLWIDVLTMPCVSLFFMVSGALLLPTKLPTIEFYKKRFTHILGPTLFFSLFYLTRDLIEGTLKWEGYFRAISQIPFIPQGHVVLWFMYALTGVYVIVPVLSAWLRQATKHEVEILLVLWLISCVLPMLSNGKLTSANHGGQFYYVGGYAGYCLLGYYLRSYPVKICRLFSLLLVILISFITFWGSIRNIELLQYNGLENLNPKTIILSVGWFLFLSSFSNLSYKVSKRWKLVIVTLSSCTFGIYLIHCFVMGHIQIELQHYLANTTVMSIVLALCTFIVSFTVCLLLSYIPGAEYIIGYRRKV